MASFVLTQQRREAFERDGMLSVPGFFDSSDLIAMSAAVWADVRSRYGTERHQPDTWRDQHPAQFKSLNRSGAFDALRPGCAAIADEFFGSGNWDYNFPGALITFPTGSWTVPTTSGIWIRTHPNI